MTRINITTTHDNMKTITEVRESFWASHPEFKEFFSVKKRQNEYNATIRSCFVEYVDGLHRDGTISESLAKRVTL